MPELPEVEVTRQTAAGVEGATVLAVHVGKALRWPLGVAPEALRGLRAGAMQRRGKYLWLPLDAVAQTPAGALPGGLLWHLGMSGSLTFAQAPAPRGPHDHLELATAAGTLRLTDPRRFGAVIWSTAPQDGLVGRLLAKLGPEPFDVQLTPERFHATLKRFRSPIKSVLLSGVAVVGAGNIYACEALFLAGIDPRTPAADIGPRRAARLLAAVRTVLETAIAAGGSTLRDFRDAHGHSGSYQGHAHVYGREGLACHKCGAPVRRMTQQQRSTYYCAHCQRR